MTRDDPAESSERESSERELQTGTGLSQARVAQCEGLAAISHEIRTPLNSLRGFLELLAGTDLDPQQQRWLGLTRDASDHLLALVERVEGIPCFDVAPPRVRPEPVSVAAVVTEAVSLVEPFATSRPAEVRVVNAGGSDLVVDADTARLRQVLLNLLSNAIKFGPPASTVTIATQQAGDRARIEVTDEGPGVAASMVERAFTPFDRLDAGGQGVAGIGLGLALSRSLMREMSGSLEVVHEVDGRTAFRVELPLARPR